MGAEHVCGVLHARWALALFPRRRAVRWSVGVFLFLRHITGRRFRSDMSLTCTQHRHRQTHVLLACCSILSTTSHGPFTCKEAKLGGVDS